MAAKGSVGKDIAVLGLVVLLLAGVVLLGMVLSVYFVTSYYGDGQIMVAGIVKWIVVLGLVLVITGAVLHAIEKRNEKK